VKGSNEMLEQFREDIRRMEPDGSIVPCLAGLELVEWLPLKTSRENEYLDEVIRLFAESVLSLECPPQS